MPSGGITDFAATRPQESAQRRQATQLLEAMARADARDRAEAARAQAEVQASTGRPPSSVPPEVVGAYGPVATAAPMRGAYHTPYGPTATHAVAVPFGRALGFPSDAPLVLDGNPMNPWQSLNAWVVPWMRMAPTPAAGGGAAAARGGGGSPARKAPAAQQPAAQQPAAQDTATPAADTSQVGTYYGIEEGISPTMSGVYQGTSAQMAADPNISMSADTYRAAQTQGNLGSWNPFDPALAASSAISADTLNDVMNMSLNKPMVWDANTASAAAQEAQALGADRSGYFAREQDRAATVAPILEQERQRQEQLQANAQNRVRAAQIQAMNDYQRIRASQTGG